ncbi:MAG TPA: hypothetical protein QF359_02315, partial [Rhodospirillales bacterium]|nr:hypothetical protein [Rhodospirillales bacterium]
DAWYSRFCRQANARAGGAIGSSNNLNSAGYRSEICIPYCEIYIFCPINLHAERLQIKNEPDIVFLIKKLNNLENSGG